jgi:hypothetical protein
MPSDDHRTRAETGRRAGRLHRGPIAIPRGLAMALMAAAATSVAATPAADGDRAISLFRSADFRIVAKQAELPVEIRDVLTTYVNGQSIADPGRKWEPGDAVTDPALPHRRVVLAGVAKNLAFVAYQHGGRGGRHDHLLLIETAAGQTNLTYACAGVPVVPPNLDGFRAAVRRKLCEPEVGAQEKS